MKSKILLYHKSCTDGFGCCWAFKKKFGDEIDCIAISHTDPIPDYLEGKEVWISDFCFKRDVMIELKKITKSIIVIDHHKTSRDNMEGLDFCNFDMNHCGSVLSWKYLFPDKEVPKILLLVEDRDLWNWKIPNSKSLLKVLDCFPFSEYNWDSFNEMLEDPKEISELIMQGEAIVKYQATEVARMADNAHFLNILGEEIPAVNSRVFQSDLANLLAEKYDTNYAVVYFYDGKNFIFSLRSSKKKPFDVSSIAVKFGGGGHPAASGFNISSLEELNGKRNSGNKESDT